LSPLLVIVAVVVGLLFVGLAVGYAVVWLERRHRRSIDQAGTVRALQMSLFSVVQAAERHHDAVALNGDRLEGTTTTPLDAEAEARAAAATYQSMVRDRQLKDLSGRLLESTSRLLPPPPGGFKAMSGFSRTGSGSGASRSCAASEEVAEPSFRTSSGRNRVVRELMIGWGWAHERRSSFP
jgi:hypothetical protein